MKLTAQIIHHKSKEEKQRQGHLLRQESDPCNGKPSTSVTRKRSIVLYRLLVVLCLGDNDSKQFRADEEKWFKEPVNNLGMGEGGRGKGRGEKLRSLSCYGTSQTN